MIRLGIKGRDGTTTIYELVVPPAMTTLFQLPQAAWVTAITIENGNPAPPDLRAALNDAETRLDEIRKAGGWSEATWDE